jgi:hypothetical protein
VDGGATLGGQRWEDGLALRANLYAKIKATIDQLKSRDAGKT